MRRSQALYPTPTIIQESIANTMKFSIPLFCLSAVLFSIDVSFAFAQDKIFPLGGGAPTTGKVQERTKDKVVIEGRGGNQSFDTNTIARLVFDGEPQMLSRAKESIVQGQIDQAIEEFKKVDFASIKSNEIIQDYNFFKGYLAAINALRGKGDAAAASKLLLDWARENKSSHLFYLATEKLGELAVAAGTVDAEKYFAVLALAPFMELKVKGNYLTGKAMLANKKPAEAKAKFAAAAQAQAVDPVSLKFKKLASLGSALCDAAEGKIPQAIEALEKMVDDGDSSDTELFSELFNALGGVLRTAGKNEEAVLAFLKTDLLYSNEPDAHAEALYHLAQLWPLIGENQRATEAKSRLARLYPTSPWLKK